MLRTKTSLSPLELWLLSPELKLWFLLSSFCARERHGIVTLCCENMESDPTEQASENHGHLDLLEFISLHVTVKYSIFLFILSVH